MEAIEPLPEGTLVFDKDGQNYTIAYALETNNQFGYGKYLYRMKERLDTGFGLYLREFTIRRLSVVEGVAIDPDFQNKPKNELKIYLSRLAPVYARRSELSLPEYGTITAHYVSVSMFIEKMETLEKANDITK